MSYSTISSIFNGKSKFAYFPARRHRSIVLCLVLCFIWLLLLPANAQKKKKSAQKTPSVAAALNAIETKVKGMQSFPGYFPFYYDSIQDRAFLVIDKFNQEVLYINSLSAGVGSNDIGLDRGQLGGVSIVKFDRRGPKVLMIEPNYRFRAITENKDEKKAVEQAFAQSVLWGFTISAEHQGKVLVDATEFLLRDAHDVAGRLKQTGQGDYHVDEKRSALYAGAFKNFPRNTELEATLTFEGDPRGEYIQQVAPTASSVTVRQHHSFVELPDNDYQPRKYDPRSGFFGISYYDYATPISEPIEKRFIARHRLQKKDPLAELSEAVEPIIYYLDRGTPEPIRSALLDGARWWNQAFESAGYKDAFRVEMLPEDADPMDVRYNLIQWVHRSTRGWSYGATVTDPRTGEIIKGHVTLGSLRVRQDFLIAEGLLAPYGGQRVPKEMEEMALARLRQLAAHEVGHTLGIAHAYSASSEKNSSVMDYPHPIVKEENGKISLRDAYDTKIGEWDKVSIQFGYQDFPDGSVESDELNNIIRRSLDAGMSFLSDQDARPAGGAHPFAHLWDNGPDAADELKRVLNIRTIALNNFGPRNIRPGYPMAKLEEALVPVYFFHRYQLEAASKIVGGLNYRYAMRGDGQLVTELVAAELQVKALDALVQTLTPATLALPESIIKIIPPRPMDFERHRELFESKTDLAFDPLTAAETAAGMTLGFILHPARANRLVEHHARDAGQPSLEFVIDKMITQTFKAAAQNGYNGSVQMTVNEVLIDKLINLAADTDASAIVRAIATLKLNQLSAWLTGRSQGAVGETWKAHFSYARTEIMRFMDNPTEFKPEKSPEPPPGAPIGSTEDEFCSQIGH